MPEYNHFISNLYDLKDFVIAVYVIIDDIYKRITPANIRNRRNINDSKMSDSEIITIGIVGELLTIDSEKAWLGFCKKNLKDLFPLFCERSRFNRTRRNLQAVIGEIRKEICKVMDAVYQDYRIIDSMPIPVCKFGRARFHKTFRGYGAVYGRCPSKKETYLGYKLHLLITLDGFVTDFIVTPANIDDREAMWELIASYHRITLLGDKGYIGVNVAEQAKDEQGITLIPLQKDSAKEQLPKPFRQLIFKLRRRIETSNSQLAEQLNIEKVRAKSFWGFISRIKTKLLAYNLCFYINKLIGNDINISKIKNLVFG